MHAVKHARTRTRLSHSPYVPSFKEHTSEPFALCAASSLVACMSTHASEPSASCVFAQRAHICAHRLLQVRWSHFLSKYRYGFVLELALQQAARHPPDAMASSGGLARLCLIGELYVFVCREHTSEPIALHAVSSWLACMCMHTSAPFAIRVCLHAATQQSPIASCAVSS